LRLNQKVKFMSTFSLNLPPHFTNEDLRRVLSTLVSKIKDLEDKLEKQDVKIYLLKKELKNED